MAEALGLKVVECKVLASGKWAIQLDDNTEATTLYKMMMADNESKVRNFLMSKVVPPPWGLVVAFTFYFGDVVPRSSFTVEWPGEKT